MIIKNATLSTVQDFGSLNPQYKLVIELPLPGGRAIYEIPVLEAFVDSLEQAVKLMPKEEVEF